MSYQYEAERHELFTEEGQRLFLKIRDKTFELIAQAGACRLDTVLHASHATGDAWLMLACFDRMLELGEISEVTTNSVAQMRIFTRWPT